MTTSGTSRTTPQHDWCFALRLAGASVGALSLLFIANAFSGLDAGRNTGTWFTFDRGLRRAVPVTLLAIGLLLVPARRPVWAWVFATVAATALVGALIARTLGTGPGLPGQ